MAGHDARDLPLSDRRALLEELASGWEPPLSLSPTTTDRDVAAQWFEDMPPSGIEGLVFKGGSQPYDGSRSWLKLKHKNVLDVLCAAVIGSLTQPQAIVAGLPVDGQLRTVGRSTILPTRTGRELGRHLRPAQPGHPWPEEISEASLNRFSKDKGPVHLTLIEPPWWKSPPTSHGPAPPSATR